MLLVIVWIVVATRLAASNIEHSRTEGTARFGQLAKARILAEQARTDETLQLIARGDITASEASFDSHVDELGTLLDKGPSATADGVMKWTASHRKQVEAYLRGDYPAAVAQAVGPGPTLRRRSSPSSNPACARRSSNPRHAARWSVCRGCDGVGQRGRLC